MSYTMIISEKKQAAYRIAKALDDEAHPREITELGVTFFQSDYNNQQILVVPSIGHLYNITSERKGRFYYPVFNVMWKPTYEGKKRAMHLANWIKIMAKIAKKAHTFISATDYDIEGEVIGYTILKYACGGMERNAKRLVFSTLTETEIRAAFQKVRPQINYQLVKAGETRHIIDFLWGVNLSRALTIAVKNQWGGYQVLSMGRVQAPTLKFIVDKEVEIQSFVPIPYWEITSKIEIKGEKYDTQYGKGRLKTLSAVKALVKKCDQKIGFLERIDIRTFQQNPPFPFDLLSLQGEAYQLFRYAPSYTLNIAERLYLDALISYPRTSSQKLPSTIDYTQILMSLRRERKYTHLIDQLLLQPSLEPNEGERSDPAHPAIYPTGNLPERSLPEVRKRLFDLIVKRFLAVFGKPAMIQRMKIIASIEGEKFNFSGKRVLTKGWRELYEPFIRSDEVILPTMEQGETVVMRHISHKERYTSPPSRYNPHSLLKLMDDEGLGTKTTRASIIDTLYDRGYVQAERMEVTNLGFNVVETLETHSPSILSVDFTRKLEEAMSKIEEGRIRKEEILREVIEVLKTILLELKEKEEFIGRELGKAVTETRMENRVVGPCPICTEGRLMIFRSKKTGKRFVGCSNFKRSLCNASFPLPQVPYSVKPVKGQCKRCNWPRVAVKSKGKKTWYLCLNPDCPTKRKTRR